MGAVLSFREALRRSVDFAEACPYAPGEHLARWAGARIHLSESPTPGVWPERMLGVAWSDLEWCL